MGELLKQMAESGERARAGRPNKADTMSVLDDLGISDR